MEKIKKILHSEHPQNEILTLAMVGIGFLKQVINMKENYQKIRSDPFKLVLTVLQGLISLWITGIGLFLYSDQHYFFWPPDWSNIENDIRIDTFIVLVGLVLFLCTIFGVRNRKVIATLLVCCGAISLSMATLSLLHVIMSNYWVMGLNVIGEIILFILILLVAHYLQGGGTLARSDQSDLSNRILDWCDYYSLSG